MERAVNAMSDAFDDIIDAAADFLRSHAASGGLRAPERITAMQGFMKKWELFKEKCDRAEDFVLTARRNMAGEFAAVATCDGDDDDNWQIAEPSNADDSKLEATGEVSPPSASQTSGSQASKDAVTE